MNKKRRKEGNDEKKKTRRLEDENAKRRRKEGEKRAKRGSELMIFYLGRKDQIDAKKVPPNGRLPDASKAHDHIR
jgi:hypothetical protein